VPDRPKVHPITNLLGAMDGAEIPGGCDQCDAVQKVRMDSALVFIIDVFHDEDCPTLTAMQKRRDQ
jgi:hypothetical protein